MNGGGLPRLFFILCVWQFVLHLLSSAGSGDPRLIMPHIVAWLHDVLLLGLIAGTACGAGRIAPQMRRSIHAAAILFLALAGTVMAIYPQTLREYLSFPVNIFSTDKNSIRVTLLDYLGIHRLWPALATAAWAVAALYQPIRCVPWRVVRLILAPVIFMGLVTLPRSPHPFMHSITQYAMAAYENKPRVVPSLRRPSGSAALSETALESGSPFSSQKLTADRVFIIVLEGITSVDFESRFLTASSRFLARVSGNYAYFNNYHATNLDSYTSLIAMLTSKQVPYRAYADERLYKAVNQTANVTRTLRNLGFYTLFTSTCSYHPFIPVRTDWDRIMIRGDFPAREGWTTVGSNRMEAAVEDRAALAGIIDTVAAHPKTMVMHELIYGHTTEWQAKTGISPLEYYDRYLSELFDALKSRGLDKRCLLVVVSDHGDRSLASRGDNYRVPLLIVGEGVQAMVDSRFRNHLDLQGIMAAQLTGTALPVPREKMFTVGSTERWVYGELRADGEQLFIDDNPGTVLNAVGSAAPLKLQQEFQRYLDLFGSQYGN